MRKGLLLGWELGTTALGTLNHANVHLARYEKNRSSSLAWFEWKPRELVEALAGVS